MFGGTQLIISGPCFNKTLSMKLVMSNGEEVPCQKYNEFSVSCISPEVYRTGKEMVSLHLIQGNNQTMIFSGVLTIGKYHNFYNHQPRTVNNIISYLL